MMVCTDSEFWHSPVGIGRGGDRRSLQMKVQFFFLVPVYYSTRAGRRVSQRTKTRGPG